MPILTADNPFRQIDDLVIRGREYFRSHAVEDQRMFSEAYRLFFVSILVIGKIPSNINIEQYKHTIATFNKAVEAIIGMYYLTESSMYDDSARVLVRNITELIAVGIAIGFDYDAFVNWRNQGDEMKDFHRIIKLIRSKNNIPTYLVEFSNILSDRWNESSRSTSHQLSPDVIKGRLSETQKAGTRSAFTNKFGIGILNEGLQKRC